MPPRPGFPSDAATGPAGGAMPAPVAVDSRCAGDAPADSEARFDAILPAPFGRIGVRASDSGIEAIQFLAPGETLRDSDAPLIRQLASRLQAYYADPHATLDIALSPRGTAFQQRVWQAIRAVPCGRTETYGALAAVAGGTARAVGQACGDNPFPLVVPCHRVVGARGLGGFSHRAEDGFHLEVKRWLLRHERVLLL